MTSSWPSTAGSFAIFHLKAFINPSFEPSISSYIHWSSPTWMLTGKPEVGKLLEDRVHARVVDVHAARATQPAALVAQFADAPDAERGPALQFRNHARGEAGLVGTTQVEPRPHLETGGIHLEEGQRIVQALAGATHHHDGLLDAHRVHRLHPGRHGLSGLDVGMGVHVDDREPGLVDRGLRDLVDGCRTVVLEQQLVGRRGARGLLAEGPRRLP